MNLLNRLWPLFALWTPWKQQKTKYFLVFSGGKKCENWPKWIKLFHSLNQLQSFHGNLYRVTPLQMYIQILRITKTLLHAYFKKMFLNHFLWIRFRCLNTAEPLLWNSLLLQFTLNSSLNSSLIWSTLEGSKTNYTGATPWFLTRNSWNWDSASQFFISSNWRISWQFTK